MDRYPSTAYFNVSSVERKVVMISMLGNLLKTILTLHVI